MSELSSIRKGLSKLLAKNKPTLSTFDPKDVKKMLTHGNIGDIKELADALLKVEQLEKSRTLLGRASSTTAGQLLTPFAVGGLATAGGVGVASALEALTSRIPRVNEDKLNLIIQQRPMLQSISKDRLMKYYAVINSAAPTVINDPMVAGSILERVVNFGGIDHTLMKELADAERTLRDSRNQRLDVVGNVLSVNKNFRIN